DQGEVGVPEPVARPVSGGVRIAEWRWYELAERRVRRRLQLDGGRPGNGVDPVASAARVDALDRSAVVVDDQPLALEPGGVTAEPEVDHRFDSPAAPVIGDLAREHEPGRRPRSTPHLARLER